MASRPTTREGRLAGSDAWGSRLGWAGLAALGALLGVSQAVNGAYSETTWAPIALGALGIVVALTIAFPRRPSLALLFPLLGLWLWSLISSSWSDSADNSVIAANRWLLYAAVVAILWWLIGSSRRRAAVLLSGAAAAALGVGVYMLVRMLAGHGPGLFLGARLNNPLGYVNGQAGYLLVGVWPCLALAERPPARTRPVWAGLGLGAVVVLIGVELMTQSRSGLLAIIGSTALLLAALPGRRRRAAAVVLVAGAIAVIYSTVSRVWLHPNPATGVPTVDTLRHAAAAILIGAAVVAIIWMAAVDTVGRLAPEGTSRGTQAARVGNVFVALLVLAALLAVAVNISSISHRIHTQYDAFVHLSPSPRGTRLFSGGGNRYDYWRVAVLEFRSKPLSGVGAGNYQPGYYLHRRTGEDIQQPHSLELQTLAELGIVGALMLLAFLGAVAIGFARTARVAAQDPLSRTVVVAAGGVFIGWLIQTSVDWLHLLPGLTAIALAAAVALVRPLGENPAELKTPRPGRTDRVRFFLPAVAALIAIAGVITIAPRVLALDSQSSAERSLGRGDPVAAIRDASTALADDPNSVEALVLRAAGFARLHAFEPTLADLRRAIAIEPRNWALWALLGDLFTRRRQLRPARAAYQHALALDPLEPELRAAVAH